MGPLEITGPARLVLGLVTGILFGFILQKAQVTKYQKIVSFFRWTDLTVQKVMFAAILVGMVGVYALHDLRFGQSPHQTDAARRQYSRRPDLRRRHVAPWILTRHVCRGLRRRSPRRFVSRRSRYSDRCRSLLGSLSVYSK